MIMLLSIILNVVLTYYIIKIKFFDPANQKTFSKSVIKNHIDSTLSEIINMMIEHNIKSVALTPTPSGFCVHNPINIEDKYDEYSGHWKNILNEVKQLSGLDINDTSNQEGSYIYHANGQNVAVNINTLNETFYERCIISI